MNKDEDLNLTGETNSSPATTGTDINSDRCWTRFMELTTKWEKPQNENNKQIFIDKELHATLAELEFPNMKLGDKLNIMLRAFMETHINELKEFRKKSSKSIFDRE